MGSYRGNRSLEGRFQRPGRGGADRAEPPAGFSYPRRTVLQLLDAASRNFARLYVCFTTAAGAADGVSARLAYSMAIEFVPIPAGTFAMGTADNDPEATASEKPRPIR